MFALQILGYFLNPPHGSVTNLKFSNLFAFENDVLLNQIKGLVKPSTQRHLLYTLYVYMC